MLTLTIVILVAYCAKCDDLFHLEESDKNRKIKIKNKKNTKNGMINRSTEMSTLHAALGQLKYAGKTNSNSCDTNHYIYSMDASGPIKDVHMYIKRRKEEKKNGTKMH